MSKRNHRREVEAATLARPHSHDFIVPLPACHLEALYPSSGLEIPVSVPELRRALEPV